MMARTRDVCVRFVRHVALVLALCVGPLTLSDTSAWAHASLLESEPADGSVLAGSPPTLRLVFNEPVTPLVMRIIGPDGEAVTPAVKAENETVTLTPPALRRGTNVLSWRVISADGHPVGGAVVFSIGAPSAGPTAAVAQTDPAVGAATWIAKVAIYIGLFAGIGGAVFIALFAASRPLPGRAESFIAGTLIVGFLAAIVSLGLQGLDALGLAPRRIGNLDVWTTGARTSYGATALIAAAAMATAFVALHVPKRVAGLVCALAALAGVGAALAASGHASTVEPRLLSRSVVFLHGICVAFWVGSLVPLVAIVRAGERGNDELAAFSRWIPLPLAVLVATGSYLIFVELDRPDALWTTGYGEVLSAKLVAVLALIALGAVNRFWLVPRVLARKPRARRPLAASIAIESGLALAILATVALRRFTPPPRSLISAASTFIHFHGSQGMAQIEVEPVRARGATFAIEVLDGQLKPMRAQEVGIVIANASAGIEPIRRAATNVGGSDWTIDDLRIPVGGRWSLRVDILVDDFHKVTLEDDVILPRMP